MKGIHPDSGVLSLVPTSMTDQPIDGVWRRPVQADLLFGELNTIVWKHMDTIAESHWAAQGGIPRFIQTCSPDWCWQGMD